MWIRLGLALIPVAVVSCASSEDVGDGPPGPGGGGQVEGGVDGGIAGTAGTTGFGGISSGGFGSGGFPSTDGSTEGSAGFPSGGSGGSSATGGGGGCGAEICNGVDDDCDGKVDNGVCGAGCTGQKFDNHAYAFCATAKALSEAAADCITQKMKPARPNDANENAWLLSTAAGLSLTTIWLGATDWTIEGNWEWPDGTPFWVGGKGGSALSGIYTNWAPNHPTGTNANDCMWMDATGTWSEVSCTKSAAYVCEDY